MQAPKVKVPSVARRPTTRTAKSGLAITLSTGEPSLGFPAESTTTTTTTTSTTSTTSTTAVSPQKTVKTVSNKPKTTSSPASPSVVAEVVEPRSQVHSIDTLFSKRNMKTDVVSLIF